MAATSQDTRMQQSQTIARVGCFGAVIVLAILIAIGALIVRTDLGQKKAEAEKRLALINEQIIKAPGILDQMLVFKCGPDAEASVKATETLVDKLGPQPTISQLKAAWDRIQLAWDDVKGGCIDSVNQQAFIDLSSEMEGVRNRKAVEIGNYVKAADEYNQALGGVASKLFASDMKPLDQMERE